MAPSVRFDPRAGRLPAPVAVWARRPPEERPALVLLVGPEAGESGWPASSAIAMAEALVEAGERLVLCDLSLASPELHEALRVPNREGVSDIFLYGASLRRVAVRAGARGIMFVPAGPETADPAAILEHPRWERMLAGAVDAAATLLLYLPADSPGRSTLLGRVGAAVILSGPNEASSLRSSVPAECAVLASLVPGGTAGTRGTETVQPEPDAPGAPPSGRARDAAAEGSRRAISGSPSRYREAIRLRAAALALVVALLALGGWLIVRALSAREVGARPTAAAAGGPGEVAALEVPLPWSVVVEVHQDLEVALRRAAALGRSVTETPFFVTPVPVAGAVYYRVMAGPVPDSVVASSLVERLVRSGEKRARDAGDIVRTSLAFHLGDFADSSEARARTDTLAGLGLPAYVVEVPDTGGRRRYRLYAGAYESREQGQLLERMLRGAGIEATLTDRTGRRPE